MKILNPLKGATEYGWHFEQEVFDPDGLARALKSGGGSGNIPKVILYEDGRNDMPEQQGGRKTTLHRR